MKWQVLSGGRSHGAYKSKFLYKEPYVVCVTHYKNTDMVAIEMYTPYRKKSNPKDIFDFDFADDFCAKAETKIINASLSDDINKDIIQWANGVIKYL